VRPPHSQISSLSTAILALGNTRSRREPSLAVGVLTGLGDAMFCQKNLQESSTMGRRIEADSLICSLGHYDMRRSHSTQAPSTVSHCPLTNPTGECLFMDAHVSSDLLPSYIMATRPVLEIFKMAGYFPDRPRT